MAPATWRVWTALGLVYVVWGSTYLGIRYAVETVPPLLGAGTRYATAAVLLAGYLLARRGRSALRATRRQAAGAAVVGLLLLLGGNAGVTLAERRHLPTGLTALLIAGVPFYVVVLRWVARDAPRRGTVIGVCTGIAGLGVLLLPGSRPHGVTLGPALTVVAASMCWAVGSVLASRLDLPPDPLWTSTLEMAAGALGILAAAAATGEHLRLSQVSTSSALALAYLVVFGSIVAFTAYSWLLGVAPVSKVATYAYVNPVVAVLLGSVVAGESLSATTVLGGAVTVVAVVLVVSGEGRRAVGDATLPAGPQLPEERQGRARSSAT